MKKNITLFFAFIFTIYSFSQTEISGIHDGDLILTSGDSPYELIGNLIIYNGTLTIEPNVTIDMAGGDITLGYSFASGSIVANQVNFINGSSIEQEIRFRGASGDSDGSFINCNFDNVVLSTDTNQTMRNLSVNDCDFSNITGNSINYRGNDIVDISNTVISSGSSAINISGSPTGSITNNLISNVDKGIVLSPGSSFTVSGNDISNASNYAVRLGSSNVNNNAFSDCSNAYAIQLGSDPLISNNTLQNTQELIYLESTQYGYGGDAILRNYGISYQLTGIPILYDGTLTIEPNVTIDMAGGDITLGYSFASGSIVANQVNFINGSSIEQEIRFRGASGDSDGSFINCNFDNVVLSTDTNQTMRNLSVNDCDFSNITGNSINYRGNDIVDISNTVISSGSSAINISGSPTGSITNNLISNVDKGIVLSPGSSFTVSGNDISNASNYAVRLGSSNVNNNAFSDCSNAYAIQLGSDPLISNNTLQNTQELIYLESTQYGYGGDAILRNYGISYQLTGIPILYDGTLTIEPNVTIDMAGGDITLGYSFASGSIVANQVNFINGSSIEQEIRFRGASGDSDGSFINCNFDNVVLSTDTNQTMRNLSVNDCDFSNITGNSINYRGNDIVDISNTVISSGSTAIKIEGSPTGSVTNCDFYEITNYSIDNSSNVIISAENNYWGDPSGPFHSTNPNGLGFEVSDFVDFTPWAVAPNNPYYHASTSVYNLSDSGDLFSSQLTEVELQLNDLKIAADGSSSTVFKFTGLDDYTDIGFKLKEPISTDPALHGIFESGTVVNDTLKVTYTHPEYFSEPDSEFPNSKHKDYTIQIYNTQDNTIIEEHPIKIVRPSLLMVHGLWGTNSTFEEMEVNLMQQNTKMYDDFQTNRMSYIASISNNLTVGTLNAQKEVLKSKAILNNISLGKIDVLAHSNGGLLTRTYIQSNFFRNDINKFITFNTPHSGSQLANLILQPSFYWLHNPLRWTYGDPTNGLVENLKVDSEFIEQLNGEGLEEYSSNYSNIALHTLTSKDDLLNTIPSPTWDLYIFTAIKFSISTGINTYYNQIIFNGDDHDKVVTIPSQRAGLPSSATSTPPFTDQYHIGSTKNPAMINKAVELLNQNPNDANYFTKQGYNPVELSYSSNANLQVQTTSTESVAINSPTEGASYVSGSTVNIDLTGTSGITDILTALGNQDIPVQVHTTENNSSDNFQLTIPNEAIGRVEIVSSGFDANGFADNAFTHIMVNTNAVLDSIQIDQDLIYTAEGQLGQFDVSGSYNDNITRNITNLQGLQYTFATGNAEFTDNGLITGLNPGVDTLTVSYLGESSSVPITIASQDEWVQLELNTRIKTFLQGPYDVNTGLMNDDLRSQNLIPLTSPYPDNRPAGSGVFDAGGITGNGLAEDDIVDWIWIELRNENDPTIVEEAKSALLQRDGDIVEPDGFSRLSFYSPEGDYYIVVKHRNHLSIMSQNPVSLSWYTADVDFTNGNITTFGTNAQNVLSDGNLALWAGDVSNDGNIQYAGSTPESTSLLSFVLNDPDNFLNLPTHAADGYNNEDVNMDGITQYAGSDAEMPLILQNVLSSPLNFLNLISFPIEEQLPENVND